MAKPGAYAQTIGIASLALAVTCAAAQDSSEAPAAVAAPDSLPVETLDSPAAAPATAEATIAPASAELETVVVTAQKREQSLQKTPISLAAFDKKKLETLGIQGVADLATNVPTLTVDPFPTNSSQLRLFIRGIGIIDAQVTQDAAVGVYIDGVYIARSTGLALDIADLERVEVLRGPQGTLYGRNATGGAINLITKKPSTSRVFGSLNSGFGSRGNWLNKGTLNLPLGGVAAVKLSALRSTRDGFQRNDGEGGDFGDRENTGYRVDARWFASDRITADYTYDLSDVGTYNPMFQAVLPSVTTHGRNVDLFKAYAQSQTVYSGHQLHALRTSAPFEQSTTKVSGHALSLGFDLGATNVKYIGAYRKLRDGTYADLGGGKGSPTYRLDTQFFDGPAADLANGGPTPLQIPTVFQQQFSHELQFGGKLLGDRVEFITGAYYFKEWGGEDGRPLHHVLSTLVDPSQATPVPGVNGLPPELLGVTNPSLVNLVNYLYLIENRALALYGQFTWTPPVMEDRLHLTAGYRRSKDRRAAGKDRISDTYLQSTVNGEGTARLLSSAERFDNVRTRKKFSDNSPSFNVLFDLSDNASVYLSSAKAYKSGGFNVRDPQVSAASGPAPDGVNYGFGFIEGFQPERVHSYELGVKSELFQRRLRLNADVFRTNYRDEQINFLIAGSVFDTKTINAGRARVNGFELDATYLVAPGLVLTSSYAFLDAKNTQVLDVNGNNVASRFLFVSAPPHSGNAAVDWTFLKRGWGRLRAYGNYSYIGPRKGSPSLVDFREGARVPGYGVVTAQLGAAGLKLGGKNELDITLWGRNLLDREYVAAAIDNLPQADRAVIFGEPRSVGLSLGYRFR